MPKLDESSSGLEGMEIQGRGRDKNSEGRDAQRGTGRQTDMVTFETLDLAIPKITHSQFLFVFLSFAITRRLPSTFSGISLTY